MFVILLEDKAPKEMYPCAAAPKHDLIHKFKKFFLVITFILASSF
jgi:hypothetical protein